MQDQKKKLQASRASPVPPAPPKKAAAVTGDPFDADDLDQLVQSRRAASSTSMVSSKPSVGSALDDFDALFGGPVSPVQPNVPGEPGLNSVLGAPYQPNEDLLGVADNEDDLLGVGLGRTVRHAPPMSLQENERRPSDDGGGLLPGFGPAIFSQQQERDRTTQDASMRDPMTASSNEGYVSDSFASPPPQYDELYKGTNGPAAVKPPPSEKSQRGSLWTSGTELGEDHGGSDHDHDLWTAPRRPAPRPPTALDSDEASTGVTADLTQRAQRAFQSSAAWFARASRKVQESVRELQERRAGSGAGSRRGSRPQTPGDESEVFYRDWATQIEAQSPRTRSAMLGALTLDDRAIVERILGERNAGTAGQRRLRRHERHHSGAYSDTEGSGYYVRETVSPRSGWASNDDDGTASPLSVQETSQHLAEALRTVQTGAHRSERRADDTAAPEPSSGVRNGATPGPPLGVPSPPPTAEFDLMGLGDDVSMRNNTTNTSDLPRPRPAEADHIAAMFSTEGLSRPVTATPPSNARTPASSGVSSASAPGQRPPAMADTSSYEDLYSTPVGADENEPEERRRLREARLASRHAKMAASLAEARERESTVTAEKEERVRIRESLMPQMEAWTTGKKDNIRALLSTLHTVLWEGSGWTPPSIADMVEEGKVKRWYMKANLVVHPDKVRQKGGSPEAIARADMIFDVLKAAWGKFEAQR